MTGFGAAEGEVAGRRARVEIRTVNHRHHHAVVRLPADLATLEAELRELLKRRIERGSVSVTVTWADDTAAAVARIDWDQAVAAADVLRQLRERLALGGEVTLDQVLRFPDVMGSGRTAVVAEWGALEPVVTAALAACVEARVREGAALSAEIAARLEAIGARATRVAELLPARLDRELGRLRANVQALLGGASASEERLAQEIAIIADRVDVTEELVRLRAHLEAARQVLGSGAPAGRQLGFLSQELGREVNTIGSKANDAAIAHEVVAMKGELEKVKEQLENLE